MEYRKVKYTGPHAQFASLTGSPLWGMDYKQVAQEYTKHGWTLLSEERPPVPYGNGVGPVVIHFKTREGRDVIWIPSYGITLGKDMKHQYILEKVFWVLWKAGVKVLLIGGTSGIAAPNKFMELVKPGDIVLPWSFYTMPYHRGLPGTKFETSWPAFDLTLDDPFCPDLAKKLESLFRPASESGLLGQIHTADKIRAALIEPQGITFETSFDILHWRAVLAGMYEEDPTLPIVSLHGDCINPVLARLLGIHVAYYHLVANYAQGTNKNVRIVETLYPLYLDNFLKVSLEVEREFLESTQVPSESSCSCISSLSQAPEVFSKAMAQS